jgi:pimeloyl-ACP methyl ester carboxylesterase
MTIAGSRAPGPVSTFAAFKCSAGLLSRSPEPCADPMAAPNRSGIKSGPAPLWDMEENQNPSNPHLNSTRTGAGPRILLLHGLGGHIASWGDLALELAKTREVIAVDLPGHGASAALPGAGTFPGVADGVAAFIRENKLEGVDVAGLSLGGRVALEMARRGLVGATVALAPGGFWNEKERVFLKNSLLAGRRLSKWTRRALPFLTRHKVTRAALLAQLSARPGQVPQDVALRELRSFAATPTFNELVRDLAEGPIQEGADDTPGPVTIVWGRKDRLLSPRQAEQAMQAFPKARLHWLEDCGHYIPWDAPGECLRLIREGTSQG